MISEDRPEDRRIRALVWALLASALLHALVLPVALWAWGVKLLIVAAQPPRREIVVSSTAIRIERRSVAQPRAAPAPAPVRPAAPPAQRPARRSRPLAASAPHELARQVPAAAPQPLKQARRSQPAPQSLAEHLARERQSFAAEVAAMHARSNPLSVATTAPQAPSAYHRAYLDTSGERESKGVNVVVLFPLQHWMSDGLSCYYARYVAQLAHGGTEDGTIPWPVCYPRSDDRMRDAPRDAPIPYPPRDYVLPSGTYLTPLLRSWYEAVAGRNTSGR